MGAKRGEARQRILAEAITLTKTNGADSLSVESVAKAAGSAKGLVHYHFKTKQGLLSAVAEEIASERKQNWSSAFKAPSAESAVQQTWDLLTEESTNGTAKAWQTLVGSEGRLTDGLANNLRMDFSKTLCSSFFSLLRRELGLTATVTETEVGRLLEAVIEGMGFQLMGGVPQEELEGAYSAAWLGVLSLTRPIA